MRKIFIIEDDANIREMLIYALASSGLEAEGFMDGESFFSGLHKTVPSLLLLDIMLPGEDGISILKRLKQSEKYKQIPVIMLTARGTELDRVKGLDLGADDYITKPFSVMEAMSRVKAVLRRSENSTIQPDKIIVGSIVLHKDKHTVYVDNKEVSLTYKEFELLNYMMINEGIVLSREKLMDNVWGYDYPGESRTVDMHIKTLRQKLGSGDLIKTVRNVGYKMEG